MAQKEVIKILQAYINLLNEAGSGVRKAFLFGSFARNEERAESDIDVMLVSEKYEMNNIEAKAKAWQLTRKIDTHIEPFSIGMSSYFSNEHSALLAQIKNEGIEIAI